MNSDISNKSILVVGANGTMAKETIKHLVKDSASKITMACRTEEKGFLARDEIISEISSAKKTDISVVGGFDMNDPEKIEKAVESLPTNNRFDAVFLAAGFAVFEDDYQSVEWNGKKVEKNIFQNMIGSHITLSLLKKYDLLKKGVRVVMAGGEGARGIRGMIEKPTFKSPKVFRDYAYLIDAPKYNPMNAIGVSKLCGALWTTKISQLEAENMEVIWFSPGLTSGSAGLKTLPAAKRWFMNNIMFGILGLMGQSQTPNEGGRKYADCLEGRVGKNGGLIGAPEGKSIGEFTDQTPMNSAFSDEGLIEEFWNILEDVAGSYN